jgi:hypothetical protein
MLIWEGWVPIAGIGSCRTRVFLREGEDHERITVEVTCGSDTWETQDNQIKAAAMELALIDAVFHMDNTIPGDYR